MSVEPLNDARIIDSWQRNAVPWTQAVRERQIPSRRLVTDQAIVDAVLSRAPRSVLDVGCGEGWLARTLAAQGIEVLGVDVVSALIEAADEANEVNPGNAAGPAGGARFAVMSYEDIAAGRLAVAVDLVVCNFSLLGKTSVEAVIAACRSLLNPHGCLVVQTLHPLVAGEQCYRDGWRPGSWSGFGPAFTDPAPWYFRTLESWVQLLRVSGLTLLEMREPLHPQTGRPASVIFIAAP